VFARRLALQRRGLVPGLPSRVSALVRASLSMVSARVLAPVTIPSAFALASESSCADVAWALLNIPSASALASLVNRSAISCARPSTFGVHVVVIIARGLFFYRRSYRADHPARQQPHRAKVLSVSTGAARRC
jgi:hypothetical protein